MKRAGKLRHCCGTPKNRPHAEDCGNAPKCEKCGERPGGHEGSKMCGFWVVS